MKVMNVVFDAIDSIPIPSLPLGDIFEGIIDFMVEYIGFIFDGISASLNGMVNGLEAVFMFLPGLIIMFVFAGLAWYIGGRVLGIMSFIGLLLIYSLGLWPSAMATLALVLVASLIALVIGIPIGILAAKRDTADRMIRPVLDFMQTMPAFVYLIPAITLFQRGIPAGAIATIIFSMPPVVRMTNLGIRQVPSDVIEAAQSLGSTGQQLLFKVQLPIALKTIFAGINQTIMLALSMVVIASMIGAGGLGSDVRRALAQVDISNGFEAGLAVVILAMIIDRITQGLGDKSSQV